MIVAVGNYVPPTAFANVADGMTFERYKMASARWRQDMKPLGQGTDRGAMAFYRQGSGDQKTV